METLARQTIKEVLSEEANEIRESLKVSKELLGKDSKQVTRLQRRLNKITKQANGMGMEV